MLQVHATVPFSQHSAFEAHYQKVHQMHLFLKQNGNLIINISKECKFCKTVIKVIKNVFLFMYTVVSILESYSVYNAYNNYASIMVNLACQCSPLH